MIALIFTTTILFIIFISINTWKKDKLSQESNKDVEKEKEKEIDKQVQNNSNSTIKSENSNYRSYSIVTITPYQKACNIINYYEKKIEDIKEIIENKNYEIKEIRDKIREEEVELQDNKDDLKLKIAELKNIEGNLKKTEISNDLNLLDELRNDIEDIEFLIENSNNMIEYYNNDIENIKDSIEEYEKDIKNYMETIEQYEQEKQEYLESNDDKEDDEDDDYSWSYDTNYHTLKDNIFNNKKNLSYKDYITVSGSFETFIVGNSYEGRQEKFEKYIEDTYGSLFLRINEIGTIYLESEPDNLYDKNAIKVMHNEIGQLGYIPKEQTKYIRKFCPLDKMKIYFYAKYNNDANKFYTNLYLVNNENGRCGIEMRKRYKDDDDDNYINVDYKI
jgi:HIRAN domain